MLTRDLNSSPSLIKALNVHADIWGQCPTITPVVSFSGKPKETLTFEMYS